MLVISINFLSLQRKIVAKAQIIIDIMDIAKSLNSSSKKRDLRDQSFNGEEPQKAREVRLKDLNVSLDDVFTKDIKLLECLHILFSCMKNTEGKRRKFMK